jgi:signal transduction histidine kinase/DNA-binding response OmpR family regulator/putative methionine-R-sulfoxide reductase with GAF domain
MLEESTKILVVDDEKGMCESLRTLLTGAGYEVTTTEQGEEALEKINGEGFDLVLTDIKMPRVDGLDILKAARNRDQEALVILMTGYASLESAISAINQGAYDYLMKPLEFSDLKLTIQRALEKRRADREKNELLDELKKRNLELKRRVAELNALYNAGLSLSTTEDLKVLLSKIVSLATEVMEAESGSIMLIQKQEKVLTIEAAIGLSEEIIKSTRLELGSSIAGHVAQTDTPLVVKDIEEDPQFSHLRKKHYATKSLLCVPLKVKDKVLGVINLSDKKGGGTFTGDDLKLLATFASQAAIAIDDAEQFSENLRKIEELEALHDIAGRLSSVENFEGVCDLIFENIRKITPVEFALWFSWNEKTNELVASLFRGYPDRKRHISIFLDKDEILEAERVNVKIKESLTGDRHLNEHLDSMASFPIVAERCCHGVLSVGNRQGKSLTGEQRRLISIILSQSASAFEKQKTMINATRLVTMGNLVSEITHDLKKPLTNIKGTLQLLREKWSNSKDKEKYFSMVEEEIFHLDSLVKEIVSFSNPYKYEMERKDIVTILNRALKLVQRDLSSGNITLKNELMEGHTVLVDKNQIMEVFLNIILNAIESMPKGGELGVKNSVYNPPQNGSECIRVEISDTGCGIAPENLNRLFERYYTTKKEGTGLGLSVVERIVKAHGGAVSVESELSKGTTFYVDLPMA